MSYRHDLKLLRRARKQAKQQQRQLADLELTGLTAVTLHTHIGQLTVSLCSTTGAPFTDSLRELLRDRRQALQAEAQHLRRAWLEDKQLRDLDAPVAGPPLP